MVFSLHKDRPYMIYDRTIMALWRTRTSTTDQKEEIAEFVQREQEEIPEEVIGSVVDVEDTKMSKIYTAELPICVNSCFLHPNLLCI